MPPLAPEKALPLAAHPQLAIAGEVTAAGSFQAVRRSWEDQVSRAQSNGTMRAKLRKCKDTRTGHRLLVDRVPGVEAKARNFAVLYSAFAA